MKSEELKALVYQLAESMDVSPKEIQIRDMKHKWASCSSKGRLTFSKDLLTQDRAFIKEVVIHELLHLKFLTTVSCSSCCLKVIRKRFSEKNSLSFLSFQITVDDVF